jgi:CheY-like chemotaxis protein
MPRILVIDDNAGVRQVVKTILSRFGYEVFAVPSGAVAIELLKNERVDLALIDIEMPDMTGFEVCTYFKADPHLRSLPVVMMTGRAIDGVPEQVEAAGAVSLVAKPFDRETLLKALHDAFPSTGERPPAA